MVLEQKLSLQTQDFENKFSDLKAKHGIEILETENKFQQLIHKKEEQWKSKFKEMQSKYEDKIQEVILKVFPQNPSLVLIVRKQ